MKICYIAQDEYPPFRADVVELFARELSRRGHTIDWIMQRGDDARNLPRVVEWEGCRVYLTRRSSRKGVIGRILNNIYGLLGDASVIPIAIKNKYDAIIVRDKFVAAVFAWLASRMTGARYFQWVSYPIPESKIYEARNGLVPHRALVFLKGAVTWFFLYKVALRLSDHAFVQSEQMREDIGRHGIDRQKMTPVPMGVRKDAVVELPEPKPLNLDRPVLLYLGIIQKIRQSQMLVEVLAKVKERYPGARLIYVGKGQVPGDEESVLTAAKRLNIQDDVIITGFLPIHDAWEYTKKADICFSSIAPISILLPASPTKLIEYMAMGKCIVANRHPEQCAVLEDSGVGKCVEWDADAFANEVLRILDHPEEAVEAAARGPGWVRKNRTYDVIADAVERKLLELTGAAKDA